MRREVEVRQTIFDLPVRKWFHPDPDLDFSATHFDRRAATPVGPAAGPHTQLAQNIVLAWLAGSRIIELKTVQVNDRLAIPRPCIHVPNVGFNVEWSQELRVGQSAMEYAKAAYLIAVLKATHAFGGFEDGGEADFDTVFDISVGYDLEGIRSEPVSGFLDALRHPEPLFDELREQLPSDLAQFRDVSLPSPISDCVTLSTFHGCPADQIQAIAEHLLEDRGLHTIIKLNPTLLGFDAVRDLLYDRLGYLHLELQREAFENDLAYEDGLTILRNLRVLADRRGSMIGAKFTNTLVVANKSEFFPTQSDPYMYLSGPPLHVISMNLMQRFREDLGFEFPVSFSAGVDAKNFSETVACGMVPVTTCTDLLRQGGYGRLPAYLRSLARAMRRVGVTTREAFVLAAHGHGAAAAKTAFAAAPDDGAIWEREGRGIGDTAKRQPNELPRLLRERAATAGIDGDELVLAATRVAGRLNGQAIVPDLANDPRYGVNANAKTPRRVDGTLGLYDCINCDLCIAACPNDAIFAYEVEPLDVPTERFAGSGANLERTIGQGFAIQERHQLAVVEGGCNECSNCEVYCPEDGAPFVVKERVFFTVVDFERCHHLDGFCRDGDVLHARLGGTAMQLLPSANEGRATLTGPGFRFDVSWPGLGVTSGEITDSGRTFDTALLYRMRMAWQSIFASRAPNAVNPAGHP